ncbi:MAG: MFS family permease [Patiriisocius sp.]
MLHRWRRILFVRYTSRRIGLSLIANKVSDLLLSPKTTLPALLAFAGAPAFLVSLLVPIRESGALLPQIVFAKILTHYPKRHIAWQIGMLMQMFCSLSIFLAGFSLQGVMAGGVMVISLACWSLSRSLCSLTYKDIQGVHINKGKRGKLIGSALTISSLITMMVAVSALYIDNSGSQIGSDKLLPICLIAMLAQVFCFVMMWPVKTCLGEKTCNEENNTHQINKDEEKHKHKQAYGAFSSSEKTILKRFVAMRSLLSHSALVAPLFTLAYSGGAISILSFLIISQAMAGVVSSYIWGALSDKRALLSMRLGAFVAAVASAILLIISLKFEHQLHNAWLIIGLFFILGIGHNGVRTGRKIYSIDILTGHKRTTFVALTNTIVGVFMLSIGVFYSFLLHYSVIATLICMLVGLSFGGLLTFTVKNEK